MSEMVRQNEKIEDLERKLNSFKMAYDMLKAEREQLRLAKQALERINESVNGSNQELLRKITALEGSNKLLTDQIDASMKVIETGKQTITEQSKIISSLQDYKLSLEINHEIDRRNLLETIDELRQQLLEQKNKLDDTAELYRTTIEELNTLKLTNADLSSALSLKENKIIEYEANIIELNNDITEMGKLS